MSYSHSNSQEQNASVTELSTANTPSCANEPAPDSKPLDQLRLLNQFITAELNPVGYRGRTRNGLLNALNGCFVIESAKPSDTTLDLVWLDDSCGNNAHVVHLEGEGLQKFIHMMQAQSAHFGGPSVSAVPSNGDMAASA